MASITKAEKTVPLNERAYDRLESAKRDGETFSDVVLRLTSLKLEGLQGRGEAEIRTSDDKTLSIKVDEDACMGAEGCAILAPEVFSLDQGQLGGSKKHGQPLGVIEVEEGTVSSEKIVQAAKSCPYQAIFVRDAQRGEQLAP